MSARSLIVSVILAFLAIAAAFTGAILLSQSAAVKIDDVSDELATDALPSVRHLGQLQADLLVLERGILRARISWSQGRPMPVKKLTQTVAKIDREWRVYLTLASFPGEEGLQAHASTALRRLAADVRQLEGAAGRGDKGTAGAIVDQELHQDFEDLGADLVQLMRLNERDGQRAVQRVGEFRGRSTRLAVTLGGSALVITLVLLLFVIHSIQRLSRLQRAHARLREERAAELELFASRIAHDLRNPLAAALLLCERARGSTEPGSDLARLLLRTHGALHRMSAMVDGLYEFARSSLEGRPGTATPLREAIHLAVESIEPSAVSSGIEVADEAIPDVIVAASAGVVASILSNLLGNAVKYAGRGAHVTVRVACRDDTVRTEVVDTGPGIPPEVQARIFQPYARGEHHSNDGLGLGLATVKRLVDKHGGACGVESTPGHGSVFWFELPLTAGQGSRRDSSASAWPQPPAP